MGALVACRMSQLAPELVDRLVLCNMPLYTSRQQAREVLQKTGRHYRLLLYSPAAPILWPVVKSLAPRGKLRLGPAGAFSPHHTYHSRKKSLRHTIEPTDALELLSQITRPTTLIFGTYDRAVYRKNIRGASLPPCVTIKWVETGHHTPLKAPEIVLAELL